ncbi:potassium/proton antiporter [Jeongeupia chitinilytica]|uniref:K(+)/H(+) antiporter NhaP2 n=1 Tax=Jeongeupia chitinilytica TaxID=1041641 RepID=A0ABQ3GWA7_9NEIS|nr:potassium/proton antiporter [Jeongeupia chitinilytica]GHD58208.1 K(+)/H(+) antiporter NhaP2 [Jeongeupia chitinilytica]
MGQLNYWLLLGSFLLLLATLSSTITARLGLPLLLVFLGVGMLAGDSGPGQIQFSNYPLAFGVGNVALAVILLAGGLQTRIQSFRVALKPALSLATVGVVVSAGLAGAFAAWLLGLPWLHAMLLGAIVGSTDAAAVFAQLRYGGVRLNERVGATLEIESGANDPMAIFLVITLLSVMTGASQPGALSMLGEFLRQFGFGAVGGLAGGWLLSRAAARFTLAESLYPLLILGGGLMIFAAVNSAGGSGFLAIYLAGLVIGNRPLPASESVRGMMDGLAWLAQAGMFLLLGLLVTPSRLLPEIAPSLAFAAFLMFIARPIAVALCLVPLKFSRREIVFVSWVGLRGAVPIVLATFPIMAGVSGAVALFDIAFAVVLASLLIQGTLVPWMAKRCKVEVPDYPEPLARHGLRQPGRADWQIVQYRIVADAPGEHSVAHAAPHLEHGRVKPLAVLRGVRLTLPRQAERLRAGDLIVLAATEDALPELGRWYGEAQNARMAYERSFFGDFVLDGDAPLTALAELYDFPVAAGEAEFDVATLIRNRLHRPAVVGDRITFGTVTLIVRELERGRITRVGLKLDH